MKEITWKNVNFIIDHTINVGLWSFVLLAGVVVVVGAGHYWAVALGYPAVAMFLFKCVGLAWVLSVVRVIIKFVRERKKKVEK